MKKTKRHNISWILTFIFIIIGLYYISFVNMSKEATELFIGFCITPLMPFLTPREYWVPYFMTSAFLIIGVLALGAFSKKKQS